MGWVLSLGVSSGMRDLLGEGEEGGGEDGRWDRKNTR